MRSILLFAWFFPSAMILAQPATESSSIHTVPFASTGNRIELVVANTGAYTASGIAVNAVEVPSWLGLSPSHRRLAALAPEAEVAVGFGFSIAPDAPVAVTTPLVFEIIAGTTVLGVKRLLVQVEAPQEVDLKPNYPNPFNPSTQLAYELPEAAEVRLRVYNILGREVARLVEEEQKAGRYEVNWEASALASGVYLARLEVVALTGRHTQKQQMMLLIK